jgi:hypothetical protein
MDKKKRAITLKQFRAVQAIGYFIITLQIILPSSPFDKKQLLRWLGKSYSCRYGA